MNILSDSTNSRRTILLTRWLAGLAGLLVLVVLLLVFFPWDILRGPVNRYVSERTGRHFEITRRLDVRLGRTTTVVADGIEFANPAWAREPYLLKAEGAEFQIRLWPLLFSRLELPRVGLRKPVLGLQIEPDGRRTWALAKDTTDEGSVPEIGALVVDQGTLNYYAPASKADISADFALAAESTAELPLSFKAKGQYKGEPFAAEGRTGGVLQLSADTSASFPVDIQANSGKTQLQAKGSITNLSRLGGIDADFDLRGQSLEDLYELLGVVLPGTPPYRVKGHLSRQGSVWAVKDMAGVLGKSDLGGNLSFDNSKGVPSLTGKLQSRRLDFADLGPMIGMAPDKAATAKKGAGTPARSKGAGGRVLPDAKLDFARLKAMNADVTYSAASIQHVKALPVERMNAHIKLNNGALQLEPLKLGVAGGELSGSLGIDSKSATPVIAVNMNARTLQLNKLFPTVENTKSSLGRISGQIDLKGRGNSTAQMLASSSGNVSLLMGRGEISNILMEFMGLDGGEVIKFLVRGDRNVRLRCAAAAFEVEQGLMSSRVILLDTFDTVIRGKGQISLANETLDIVLQPSPKDVSILSLRSPLKIGGTFGAPTAGPDKTALAGRAGLAIALAAINPLLALAATIETGPGEDANCGQALKQAASEQKIPEGATTKEGGGKAAPPKPGNSEVTNPPNQSLR